MSIVSTGETVINHCLFFANSADSARGYGGGINIYGNVFVNSCIFYSCSANVGGGGCISKYSTATFKGCTFSGNEANDGAGIGLYYAGSVEVDNSIIAFSSQGDAVSGTGSIQLSHCNVFGNAGGDWIGPIAGQLGSNGNISEDPLFVDHTIGDLHLTRSSPCRNGGDNAAVPPEIVTDIEDDPRLAEGTVDMGGDEFHTHLYALGDVVPGGMIQFRVIGTPNAPVILALGSGVQDPPQPTAYGDLFLAWPIQHASIGTINADGYLVFSWNVFSFWQAGEEFPFQALAGPLGNPASELTNLMVLLVR